MFAILKLLANFFFMQFLLAVDSGNSDTVFGLFSHQTCLFQWRTSSSLQASVADYGLFLRTCFWKQV